MKTRRFGTLLVLIGGSIAFLAASAHAQDVERELHMMSHPNANVTVDGNANDWNLSQFTTEISGGKNPIFDDQIDYERTIGTGDVALLGWDAEGEFLRYGSYWTGGVLPEEKVDNSVRFYAQDNATHQYFLVDIIEDEINTDDDAAWANDSVEFYFDPENDGDPTDWEFDVQLVIDAANRVQVWNSPIDYEEQVEAGVESVVTITDDGWMLEVGIDKSVFDTPLPAILGPANDPDGNTYGIDFSYRDNDDPDETGTRNGDTAFTSAYVWADPTVGGGFPSKQAGLWGEMIAAPSTCDPNSAGDLDGNGKVEFADFLTLSGNFGKDVGSHADGDIDCNGKVEFADFLALSGNFGKDVGQAASVPEPTGQAMLLIGVCALLLRRRK